PFVGERSPRDEQERGGERRRQRRPAAPPARRTGRRRGPLGGQTPLQRQGGRVLRKPVLEGVGQGLFGRCREAAGRAFVEVGADGGGQVWPEPSPLVAEQVLADLRTLEGPATGHSRGALAGAPPGRAPAGSSRCRPRSRPPGRPRSRSGLPDRGGSRCAPPPTA